MVGGNKVVDTQFATSRLGLKTTTYGFKAERTQGVVCEAVSQAQKGEGGE